MKVSVLGSLVALVVIVPLIAGGIALLRVEPHRYAAQPPVAIVKGDACVVCGMEIGPYPGPRAEAYLRGERKVLKFGGTRDFFAFVTQPDVATRLETLYVQDCAHLDWERPVDGPESFIDARTAYYVGFQPLPGEMGPTFAAFRTEAQAAAFVRTRGGMILRFGQITPRIVSTLAYDCPSAHSPAAGLHLPCARRD